MATGLRGPLSTPGGRSGGGDSGSSVLPAGPSWPLPLERWAGRWFWWPRGWPAARTAAWPALREPPSLLQTLHRAELPALVSRASGLSRWAWAGRGSGPLCPLPPSPFPFFPLFPIVPRAKWKKKSQAIWPDMGAFDLCVNSPPGACLELLKPGQSLNSLN